MLAVYILLAVIITLIVGAIRQNKVLLIISGVLFICFVVVFVFIINRQ